MIDQEPLGARDERTAAVQMGPGRATVPRGFTSKVPDALTRRCPRCDRDVTLKVDGTMRGHWVGSARKGGWLCPGEDTTVDDPY